MPIQSKQQPPYYTPANNSSIKEYTILITQSGTNNPTALILTNTYKGTITSNRTAAGQYTIINTLDEFTLEKTSVEIGGILTNSYPSDTLLNEVYIESFNITGANADGQLYKTYLSIKTYQ